MDAMEPGTPDPKRRTVIAFKTFDLCPHQGKRFHDPFHGAGLDGFVPVQVGDKILSGQNAGDQPGGSPAVAGIQRSGGRLQAMQPPAMDEDFIRTVFNPDSHLLEAGDGGEAVGALKKIGDFCSAFGQRAEHDAAVRDAFVSRNGYRSF